MWRPTPSREAEAAEEQIGFCRACTGARHERLFVHSGYPVYECQSCGLVFLNPQPSDDVLADIYSSRYFLEADDAGSEREFSDLRRQTACVYLEAIAAYGGRSHGRVLDVGCGKGDFLVEAATRGYEVWGIDVSPHAAQIANHRLGREAVKCSTLTKADLPSTYFDICVCVDTIEHVRDPLEYLSRLRRILKPDGVLLLVTPALDSWPARLMKRRWFEFKTEHLFYFDTETLQNVLTLGGFHAIETSRAKKSVTLEYVYRHFRRYPVPALSALVSAARRMSPHALRHRAVLVSTSSSVVLARPKREGSGPMLSVIMPVYNEHRTVSTVVEALIAKKLDGVEKEIVIVEGNSSDGSREDVLRYKDVDGVHVVLLDRNRGKGYAVREGFGRASGDIILIQDADLEYDIADYDRLIEPVLLHRRAVVLGSRHSGSSEIHTFTNQAVLRIVFDLGHRLLTGLFNLLYRQRLRDPWTMYKVFRRECIHRLRFECDRFDFDVELLAKLVRKGFAPVEVPVTYRSRSFKEGKKVKVMSDPWTWIWACVKYRVASPYVRSSGGRAVAAR